MCSKFSLPISLTIQCREIIMRHVFQVLFAHISHIVNCVTYEFMFYGIFSFLPSSHLWAAPGYDLHFQVVLISVLFYICACYASQLIVLHHLDGFKAVWRSCMSNSWPARHSCFLSSSGEDLVRLHMSWHDGNSAHVLAFKVPQMLELMQLCVTLKGNLLASC